MCVFRPWKFEHMATDLLSLQLRDDHPLPPDAILYFTQGLTHDSLSIRKVSVPVCVCVYVCVYVLWSVWVADWEQHEGLVSKASVSPPIH